MSSILKALKKLENEVLQQSEDQPLLQEIDTKKTISQHVRRYLLFNRFFFVLFAAVTLTIGGWLVFSHKLFLPERPSPGHVFPAKIDKKVAKIAPIPVQKAPAKPITLSKKETRPTVLTKKEPPATEPAKRSEAPAIKSRKQPIVKQPITADRFEEPRLKVEAIIWSNYVKSRFAVINGHIVRVGESVEGMSVEHIGRNYVTVRSGEKEFKLRFRLE